MLTLNDYNIDLTVIGNGAQAKIVRAQHIVTHELVAVKVYPLKNYTDLLCFENEARLLAQCRKIPQIIQARACFVHKQHGFLVMPLFAQDLLTKIMDENGLGERNTMNLFKQICEGVQQCHEKNIAHLDLKPDNILYSNNDEKVYICDFGNSYQFENENDEVNIGRRGTVLYSAPEVKNKPTYNPVKADIWSLGILLHVMTLGYFPHSKNDANMEHYHRGTINLAFAQRDCSPLLCELLTSILNVNPAERPSIAQILNHPWFASFNQNSTQRDIRPTSTSFAHRLSDRIFGNTSSRGRVRPSG